MPMVSWMDEKTRQIAIEKVRKIVQMIGYPEWIMDTTQLDKHYENVSTGLVKHLNHPEM
jgi:endothelin-converting enzyme